MNEDPVNIWGRANFHLEYLNVFAVFLDFQTPPDKLSDPNLTSLPTHPVMKHAARNPCYD